MAAVFTATDEARVLSADPARARANANEAKGRALLDKVLKAGDASANVRFVLNNLAGALLASNAKFAEIEQRLHALEAGKPGGP